MVILGYSLFKGAIQHLEISGEAYELGKACATAMKADGLVNVQTRHNHQGHVQPLLMPQDIVED